MNIQTRPLRIFYISISIVILSSSLISSETSQMRQVDLNEKNLLTLFAKENAKSKTKKDNSTKEEIEERESNSSNSS